MAKKKKGKRGDGVRVLADRRNVALVKAAQDKPASGGMWKGLTAGDTICGELLSMKEEQGKFGPQIVLVVDTPDGPRTVYTNESMKRGLDEEGAAKGDTVAITYRGNVATGRGRPFKLFAVAVKKGKKRKRR